MPEEKKEPHVQIFGEEVKMGEDGKSEQENKNKESRCCQNREHSGGIIWGLIVLLGGVLLLFNNLGSVPWEIWNHIWPFWPIILVLIGLQILLGRGAAADLFMILISLAALAIVILSALIQVGSPFVNYLPPGLVEFLNVFSTLQQN